MSVIDFCVQDKLQTRVEETELALAAKDGRIRVLSSEVAAARREWDRAKKNAKFDHAAREGQTKKLVILEHNITTLRHDLQTTMERRLAKSELNSDIYFEGEH